MLNISYKTSRFLDNLYYSRFLALLKDGKPVPPPSSVIWDSTRKCMLKCSHCGATKEKYQSELTMTQMKSLVNQLAEMKVSFFAATGGEPLIRSDLIEILEHARAKNIHTGIATNGFLIDKVMARRISHAKVRSVQISIDGLLDTHNKIRGNGESFQRAISAFRHLAEQKIPILQIATTVTPKNLHEMPNLSSYLREIGVSRWRLGPVMPIGRATKSSLELSPNQLRELMEQIRKMQKVHKRMKISLTENLPYLMEYEQQIRSRPNICPIGFTAFTIGVDGYVRGCPEQPDITENREGSALELPLRELWEMGFKRYRSRRILQDDKKCKICKFKFDCMGGCWVMREGNSHCIRQLLGETL